MKRHYTFQRGERLKSKKMIGQLFSEGNSLVVFPVRLVWKEVEELPGAFPAQATFSVPKRHFPKATQRNRIKRQMREAYRLHKHAYYQVLQETGKKTAFMFLFMGKEPTSYELIEQSMRQLIKRWKKKWKRSPPAP